MFYQKLQAIIRNELLDRQLQHAQLQQVFILYSKRQVAFISINIYLFKGKHMY